MFVRSAIGYSKYESSKMDYKLHKLSNGIPLISEPSASNFYLLVRSCVTKFTTYQKMIPGFLIGKKVIDSIRVSCSFAFENIQSFYLQLEAEQ